jgi:hypothetical protein
MTARSSISSCIDDIPLTATHIAEEFSVRWEEKIPIMSIREKSRVVALTAALLLSASLAGGDGGISARELTAEIAVYGATSGGVPAAVAAAREGRKVILIEPGRWLGGLPGAGFRIMEDVPFEETLGGLALALWKVDFARGGNPLDWAAKANQQWFAEQIAPYGDRIQIVYEYRVRQVVKKGARITSLLLEKAPPDAQGVPAPQAVPGEWLKVTARQFIDASYEGDVMAMAAVSYRVGRESSAEYGESLAGVRGVREFPGVSPYVNEGDPSSGLLPFISKEPLGQRGSASRYVQGWNFKFAWWKKGKKSSGDTPGQPMPPPDEQDPLHSPTMELLRRIKAAGLTISWPHYNDQRNEVCTGTIPGLQADYPDGDWATRARIWRGHVEHLERLTAFTGKDVRMHPVENADTGGWPPQLYLRCTRRMVGRYVMTQKDIALQTEIPDSIGLGFYAIDLHPARLLVLDNGTLASEGQMLVLVSPGPFRLPYRFITPRKEQCENLLVPVCFSASHLAHGAIRLEAQYMTLGESAGVAAAHALAENRAVQDLDVPRLQARLVALGQILEWDGRGYGKWRTCAIKRFDPNVEYRWLTHPEEYPHYLPKNLPDDPSLGRKPMLP